MTSEAHDATALAAAFALFGIHGGAPGLLGTRGDPTGLVFAAVCIAGLGLVMAHERRRQERAVRRAKRKMEERGRDGAPDPEEFPEVRWKGPRRSATRPVRLVAVLMAAGTAPVLGVALACARLPDQLEVGPIDHRKLTHYLVTAAGVIYGSWRLALEVAPAYADVTLRGVATGYLMHLAMDACTRDGVPFFGPVVRRKFHFLPEHPPALLAAVLPVRALFWKTRIKTGGRVDTLVMLGALCAVVMTVQP